MRKRDVKHYVPLQFGAGADARADFGEAYMEMDNQENKVHLFEVQLCYSRRRFAVALPCQKQEALFEGHVGAFEFFAGVPRRITYDNMTAATARALRGGQRKEIESFTAFRSHFCTPYEAHEKGQIEGLVGYSRRNWLVPLPRVRDFEELNGYVLEKCLEEDRRVLSGMKKSIGEMFEEEKPQLMPLPARRYECFRLHPVGANKMGMVTFERNSYSVPEEYAGRNLTLKAYVDRVVVVVTDERRVVTTKKRLYGTGEENLAPADYLNVLAKKHGAVEYARPLKVSEFAPVYGRFLSQLKLLHPDGVARREFLNVLCLEASHSKEEVARNGDGAPVWDA